MPVLWFLGTSIFEVLGEPCVGIASTPTVTGEKEWFDADNAE
jgi:hypothetical protein